MLFPIPFLAPLVLAVLPLQADDDPVKALRSKDPAAREAAAVALGTGGEVTGEAELAKAVLKDEDVRVVLAAVEALGGWSEAWKSLDVEPSNASLKALGKAALESPFVQVRQRAAAALIRIDPAEGRARFAKKASGKTFARAAEAIAVAFEALEAAPAVDKKFDKDARKIGKGAKSKKSVDRAAALRALVALGRSDAELRAKTLGRISDGLLEERAEIPAVCAMLDSVTVAPLAADADSLLQLLQTKELTTVIERRLERALAGSLGTLSHEDRLQRIDALIQDAKEPSGPRIARVLTSIKPLEPLHLEPLRLLLENGDDATRAAAAHGLRAYGKDGAEVARASLAGAKGPRTQLQLVRALEESGEFGTEDDAPTEDADALLKLLAGDAQPRIKSATAIALGKPEQHADVVAALGRAVLDAEGSVPTRVATAVALGRTRDVESAGVLDTLAKDASWQLRAAAAEGLKQLSRPESVPSLLALLDDPNATVRLSAHHALKRLAGKERATVDPETWADWWKENMKRARFQTREEQNARRDKYGYSVAPEEIYKGLDLVVVPGHGDHVEVVLERLGIEHRTIQAGKLSETGLHPGALLLVGCTGEIAPSDIETIRWFVNSGGALFTSCWALTYTVETSFPAIVSRFPSPGEVVDNVFAYPTATGLESPYLNGVFDGGVKPFYALVGAHLLHVVDPERAEVLLDSPSAAARHGSGDLAAWFRIGHGVVINSANHFEEQGFRSATGLGDALERQAFAVNHMGYSTLDLRETQDEKWWSKNGSVAAEVSDLSVFRILTNFARKKRIDG